MGSECCSLDVRVRSRACAGHIGGGALGRMQQCPFEVSALPLTPQQVGAESHMLSIYLHHSMVNCMLWWVRAVGAPSLVHVCVCVWARVCLCACVCASVLKQATFMLSALHSTSPLAQYLSPCTARLPLHSEFPQRPVRSCVLLYAPVCSCVPLCAPLCAPVCCSAAVCLLPLCRTTTPFCLFWASFVLHLGSAEAVLTVAVCVQKPGIGDMTVAPAVAVCTKAGHW